MSLLEQTKRQPDFDYAVMLFADDWIILHSHDPKSCRGSSASWATQETREVVDGAVGE